MIFFELLTVCTALRWSKTGIPLKKAERKSAKAERREKLSEPCIVHYTSQQASIAQEAGLDTSNWTVDSDSTFSKVERASSTFVKSWSNPEGFSADHLRIPFRFKTENFNEKSMQKMAGWLDDMSGYVGGCIEFYDDTNTQLYPKDYILIRNTDNSGTYDSRCWSRLGRANYYGPVVLSYQEINMGNRCIYKDTMQHEMLHSLGFKHEQQRPDRDEFVEILYKNIQPYYRYNFDKMNITGWDSYEQIYDLVSVMHYDGYSFRTDKAIQKYKPSIVYKGTKEAFFNGAKEMSSIDIVQLTRRYSAFCKEPTDKIPCSNDEKDGYFLSWKACDGYDDCQNRSDEGVEKCVDLCGSHLYVQGLESIEGNYFARRWLFTDTGGTTAEKKPYYYNDEKKIYLYYKRPRYPENDTLPRWYFGTYRSSDISYKTQYIWALSTEPLRYGRGPSCPTGLTYHVKNPFAKDWIKGPDILVTVAGKTSGNNTTTESVPLTTTTRTTTISSTTTSTTTPNIQRTEFRLISLKIVSVFLH